MTLASSLQAWEVQLSAARGGVMGGLLALSALERSPLQRVALQALPCQGGFVGLYHGMPPTHHMAVACPPEERWT